MTQNQTTFSLCSSILEGLSMYNVIDTQTKQIVGTYKSLRTAYAAADRKDAEYGAVRYAVEPVRE